MKIAILALQGAFVEHQQMLQKLDVDSVLIRNLHDWKVYLQEFSPLGNSKEGAGLIIPGGESTAMMKIMSDEGLVEPLRKAINGGMPVFGTCAGLIMLDGEHLATMNIIVRRNAYGRQLGSFVATAPFQTTTFKVENLEMVFIRAPYIEKVGDGVEVLATVDNHIVAARQGHQLVTAFHPELTDNPFVHELFVKLINEKN